ncbi:hypothetical protein ATCC90586_012061 [Pythium insidiosum]|nr:hypothetical protein ATCC90586_012061 [Pythium insidiosum]
MLALVDFELFAVVNGLGLGSDAWLARLVFGRLLELIERQTEERVRAEALRLVRRMFVALAYNARHQSSEDQELISLMFFPMVATVARFTTDGQLLADDAQDDRDTPPLFEARKELLVCVAHLLSTVSLPYLSWYFHEPTSIVRKRKSRTQRDDCALPLSPTAALMHYRRLVEETKRP